MVRRGLASLTYGGAYKQSKLLPSLYPRLRDGTVQRMALSELWVSA